MSKILIAYYSRKGENYVHGSIQNLVKGNTELVAEIIANLSGGSLFEIESKEPYPLDYTESTVVAKRELQSKARPALKKMLDDVDGYDTIIIGYPNWWGTMPMPVFTFLEHLDLTGKRILPFCTHEGSGLSNSVKDIAQICKTAEVFEGLAIRGSNVAESRPDIESWLIRGGIL